MEIITFAQRKILMGFRTIEPADEDTLAPSEVAASGRAVAKVRRRSGTARIIARTLLSELGFPPMPILKTRLGVPIWPDGVVGSLAHHDTVAAAAIAQRKNIEALGIDIEPDEPLPDGLIELIATPKEQSMYDLPLLRRRDLFVLKEAVYKAYFPMHHRMLEFQDVEIDIGSRSGYVPKAHCAFSVDLLSSSTSVIGLAYKVPLHGAGTRFAFPDGPRSNQARTSVCPLAHPQFGRG
ncbi:4-phosphopantetheinyl transferase [Mesorhizobium hawassense]|uniref:Enterobactin synthase component D n=1 Tax=Mesorhizobium hawassense TaxID=1209954 RepID=A0A330I018_9HYPH|nr:4'-phosphopantetheinyl transferase superfamily protein [Mesorhizobium hawassense]RAZ92379.1 4-phosphopantetheinyl transferase [Mesorhizobium hawassense]